ncbi:MAG TPA: hypothetical protein VGG24_13450, partial [Paraburkholderia sp.]
AASLALPVAASAQQSPQPPYYPPQQQVQQPGAPLQRGPQNLTTPSVYRIQSQYLHMFATLGITSQQQAQITGLINQFAQTHPEGSPRDRKGMKVLRQEILSVLSPQQQQQYEQVREAQQAQRAQMRQQRMQQQQAQGPQGQPQYGSPVPPQQQQPVPPNV